ncbi:aminotransferase class I/II-fold pyridoxal phosphate-dependent enzyme [Paenibacillus taichungensis]|uniref:DegT/DnrJ/EryC1/StrS family aminotransferase n=1 Tax=Paenibacillus taichungensis TaxID=484184 RepID=UPI002DBCD85B|nr:aminotransferase class I/II-fold pyridoxal phosphate-dependent enzyme [Paenibacillus taichungensis]MEC0106219.1 aminotransferase class I/II-fold pyridoxal phosphate-dependent enzyme [Paenibacillus taichungensis]MEC0199360.1 aminotransferase class I/II-fold pyridoxal phosphate-dependent enzyme [Paenibacillus taichungensis]
MRTKRIYLASPHMGGGEQRYIQEAFDTNWIAPLGANVDAFEKIVADYVGAAGAVALNSGTAAIHLALRLLGVGQGDLVLCSSLTFIASANPILYQGAIPIFIDSEPNSWNMSPQALERALSNYTAIGQKPKAVIVVNLYGQSADYESIMKICQKYEVPIVEDAAESLGASHQGRKSGTFGEFGIFSFNGNKIITTSGGGMLISEDKAALEKARFWATQARDQARHYQHSEIGYNYRMSNVLAGIGRGQMEVLEERISRKREIRDRYATELNSIAGVTIIGEKPTGRSTHWLSVMTIDPKLCEIHPDKIIKALADQNIESRPIWKPLHMQPIFKNNVYFAHDEGEDVSARIFLQGLCLPSDTKMTDEDIDLVLQIVQSTLNGNEKYKSVLN